MGYRNAYDRSGQSQTMGQNAETNFEKIAKQKGLKIEKASKKQQFSHIDYILTAKDGKKYFLDVKACKKNNRNSPSANQEIVWIEFKNVIGDVGWLYGAADYIAFERESDFIIAPRQLLASLCERLVNTSKRVDNVTDAMYNLYTRKDRKDEISIIKMEDILNNIKTSVWQK